ncbi:MAG: ORF6N domain-containing protein [Opitutaceae bacterium]|nr:ORF6N domain-containing protein [Opitutaceae bacterium]
MPKPAQPPSDLPRIFSVRQLNVVLDAEVAKLYGVPTKRLNEAMRRNRDRFPPDFSFQLTVKELASLRSQIATSNGRGGRRYLPRVFTEHGALMAATILNSRNAV